MKILKFFLISLFFVSFLSFSKFALAYSYTDTFYVCYSEPSENGLFVSIDTYIPLEPFSYRFDDYGPFSTGYRVHRILKEGEISSAQQIGSLEIIQDTIIDYYEWFYYVDDFFQYHSSPCEFDFPTCEQFVPCVASKFSSKFPFDIFFNIPTASISCPKLYFFEQEFDICWLYQIISLIKYPIAASLLFKIFFLT